MFDPNLGTNPHEIATGYTADVSAYLDFTFYDPIYYCDEEEKFPSSKEQLGHWLGPTINCGDAMIKKWLKDESFEWYCTIMLLRNSNQAIYGSLLSKLRQEYTLGDDKFPKTIV